MSVRATLRLTTVTTTQWGATPEQSTKRLRFEASYDKSIPEDQKFSLAGHCDMQVDNPAALAFFEAGKVYYMDFVECESTPAATIPKENP